MSEAATGIAVDLTDKPDGSTERATLVYTWPSVPIRDGLMGIKDSIKFGVSKKLAEPQDWTSFITVVEKRLGEEDEVIKGIATYNSSNGIIEWKPYLGTFNKDTRYNVKIADYMIQTDGCNCYGMDQDVTRNNFDFTTSDKDTSGEPTDEDYKLSFDLSKQAQAELDRQMQNIFQMICPTLLLTYNSVTAILDLATLLVDTYMSLIYTAMEYCSVEILLKLKKMINGLVIPDFKLPSDIGVGAKISFKDYINKCPPLKKLLPPELGLSLSLDISDLTSELNKKIAKGPRWLKEMKKQADKVMKKLIEKAFMVYGVLIFLPIQTYEDAMKGIKVDKAIKQLANLEFCLLNLCRPPELPKQETQSLVKFVPPIGVNGLPVGSLGSSGVSVKASVGVTVTPFVAGEWDDFDPSSVIIPNPSSNAEKEWMKNFFYPGTTTLKSRKYKSVFGLEDSGRIDILNLVKKSGKDWGMSDEAVAKEFEEVYKIYKSFKNAVKF